MTAGPRLCAKCAHVHGGGKYGLCFERLPDGAICPCIRAEIVVILRERPARITRVRLPRRERCERQKIRLAEVTYATLMPEDRAVLDRVARRLDDTMLTLEEYAAETGWDKRLIWRARRDLGLKPQPIVTGSLMRPQPRSVG